MKRIKIILGLILLASVTTFAQSPRIKLNQITKDTVKGSVLISSPSDSGMVYSRDFYIAYGLTDTVLILYGDTLAATSAIISSVLSDGVTITGNGTSGNELKVDTSLIATIKALNDSLATISASTTPDGVTITGDGSVGNPLKVDTLLISTVKGLNDTLTARNYLAVSQLTDTLNANTRGYLTAEVDGSVSNEGSLTVGAGTASTSVISSNTSGSTDVTLTAGSNITLSETGNNITIAATGGGTSYNNISENGDTVIISDHLKVDTNTLYVDATTNRVGIGTSSPQGFLSVERQFPSSSTLGLTVGDPRYEGVFQIKTASSSSFMPTFEGYGGVEDAAYPIGMVVQGSVDTSKDVSYATHGLIILQGREYDNFPNGAGPVENAPILTVKNYNDLLMKIEANGNVGIGTSSPSAKLEVKSGNSLSGTFKEFSIYDNNGDLRSTINNVGTQEWYLHNTVNNVGKIAYATPAGFPGIVTWTGTTFDQNRFDIVNFGSTFRFYYSANGASSGLNIASSGNIGIATTSPSYTLDVNGDINASGEVRNSGVILTSDARYKKDITPLYNANEKLMQFNPVSYYWNDLMLDKMSNSQSKNKESIKYGLVAQEVEAIMPEFVSEGQDGYKAIDYQAIITLLIKSNQEQQSEIDQLKTLITDLTNRLTILENK